MLVTDFLGSDSLSAGTYKIYGTPSGKTAARKGEKGLASVSDFAVEAAGKIYYSNQHYQVKMAILWSEIGDRPDIGNNRLGH